MKQLLIMVETNKNADTDWIYINATIKRVYDLGRNITVNHGYMGSKGKYKSPKVAKYIKDQMKLGDTTVIICIDTDHFEKNLEQKKETDDVVAFCRQKGYELVWFCHDVEEVYLGESIADAAKCSRAKIYGKSSMIDSLKLDLLQSEQMKKGTSNILNVLDKYLSRKKI